METTLNTLKNLYAQEQGYEDWCKLEMRTWSDEQMGIHWTEICIRAQKASLEKAADSAEVQHHNTRTGIKTCASGIGGNDQVYTVDRTSISNPENLIR